MAANTENRSFSLLHQNQNILEGKAKLDGRKTSLCESETTVRKKLGDISNFPNAGNLYIDKLQKEKASLAKLLEDKNKMIELTVNELRKLSANMQKMQQQNIELAQANSLMIADLNAGKDRLKAMQHQLGCANNLLRIKEMEQKEKLTTITCQQCQNQPKVQTSKCGKDELDTMEAGRNKSNLQNTKWAHQQKSESLDHSTKHMESKGKTEKDSVRTRRCSARFNNEKPEPKEEEMPQITDTVELSECSSKQPGSFKPKKAEPKEEDVFLSREKTENKRGRPRRHSVILKHEEHKPEEENMAEITDTAELSECFSKQPASIKPEKDVFNEEDMLLSKEDKAINKRGRPRRQSAILKLEERKPEEENMCEITDTAELLECSSSLNCKEGSIGQSLNCNEFRRSSIARPSRSAAKKVQSYKEVPLNIKMRRPE